MTFQHILLAVDPDDPQSWKACLPVAESLARCFSARLTICSVSTEFEAIRTGRWWPIAEMEELAISRAKLESIAASVGKDVAAAVEVATGTVSSGIVDTAERIGADLIALSSHHHRLADLLISPHAERIARKTDCSVLIIRRGRE